VANGICELHEPIIEGPMSDVGSNSCAECEVGGSPHRRRKFRDATTLAELRIVLGKARERGYNPYRLGQDLGITPRAVRWWETKRVPPATLALAVALAKLTPEQLQEWREEVGFLRS
jgi:DNA-binding IclR family transcriptional regulator